MPTLEIINERFARNIRVGLFNFIRKSPEVAIGGIKVENCSALVEAGAIAPEDLKLFCVCDSPQEAFNILKEGLPRLHLQPPAAKPAEEFPEIAKTLP